MSHFVLLLMRVSILVFLDTSVPVCHTSMSSSLTACFNPCFSGYLCSGALCEAISLSFLSFNPCFSGYLCSGSRRVLRRAFPFVFQSLFFWIPLFRSSDSSGSLSINFVSILVFLDTSVPASARPAIGRIKNQFQSLFFWIPLFRSIYRVDISYYLGVSILVFLDTSVPGLSL